MHRKKSSENKTRRLLRPDFWLIGLIKAYQWTLSPFIGMNCRFHPTCSEYAIVAIRQYGVCKGGWMAIKRVMRCHPGTCGGYDPVPLNDRGKSSC